MRTQAKTKVKNRRGGRKGRSGKILRTPVFCELCKNIYKKYYDIQSVVDELSTEHNIEASYEIVRQALSFGPVKNRYEKTVKASGRKPK